MSDTGGFIVAIPARHDSTRLPGKPLRPLGGEPLVLHVARRALAAGADEVWVAADDPRIVDALAGSGVNVALTSGAHQSGTDRLAECASIAGWEDDRIVVNLQGDEPFAPAACIRDVADLLRRSGAPMGTLAETIADVDALLDPNTVKLVRGNDGDALYFSRAPLPWPRDAFAVHRDRMPEGGHWLRHIGLYAYRVGFLRRFAAMSPGRLERIEALEQLRVLEAGERIAVAIASEPFPPGVDTPEDLARAEARLQAARRGRGDG